MKQRHIVTCLPETDSAKQLYFDVIKPIATVPGRLRMLSFLDFPTLDEFSRDIRTWIYLSNLVIAILEDGRNSNVLYEIGVATAFGKPVILLANNFGAVPAMLRSKNVIVVEQSETALTSLRTTLPDLISASLKGTFLDQRFQDHIGVLIAPDGLRSVADADPSVSPPDDGDDVAAGLAAQRARLYAQAVLHLERAVNTGSRDAETYYELADAYFFLGESLAPGDKQRHAFRRMQHWAYEGIRVYPKHAKLKKTLGLASMKLGDLDRAEAIFTELLDGDPEFIVAGYDLACLNALQNKRHHCVRFLADVFAKNAQWRFLARLDPDFDAMWRDEVIQRLMFPSPVNYAL